MHECSEGLGEEKISSIRSLAKMLRFQPQEAMRLASSHGSGEGSAAGGATRLKACARLAGIMKSHGEDDLQVWDSLN